MKIEPLREIEAELATPNFNRGYVIIQIKARDERIAG